MVGDFLKPLSEPVVKLIDSISGAVGALYEPTRVRRRADADADAAIILAKGQTEVDDIQFRAGERLLRREIRRQRNIESIVETAKQSLPDSVSDDPVAEDWIYDFFEQCHDVSNEQMQGLWAQILAGEVTRPRSFALHTLALVKTLAPYDAERFTIFCERVWIIDRIPVPIYFFPHTVKQRAKQKLTFDDLLDLESIGLIRISEIGFSMSFVENPYSAFYQEQSYLVTVPEIQPGTLDDGNVVLTPAGKELMSIIDCQPDEEFKNSTLELWRSRGWEVVETSE